MLQVDDLLKERESVHSSFTAMRPLVNSSESSGVPCSSSSSSSSNIPNDGIRVESPAAEDGSTDGKDKSSKKKWFSLNLGWSDKKA